MKKLVPFLFVIALFIGAAGEYARHIDALQVQLSSDATADSMFAYDTIDVGPVYGFKTLQGRVDVRGPSPKYAGISNEDSVIIQLWSSGFGVTRVLFGDTCDNGMPCSLKFTLPYTTGDSALRENLQIYLEVIDTLSDTTITATYDLNWDMILK